MSAKIIPQPVETLERRFQRLLESWHRATDHHSSLIIIRGHPAFRELIGLGEPAIPLMLRALADPFNFELTTALHTITGEAPTTAERCADRESIVQAWLRWGRQRGYQC
jgi:hypothetical protein